MEIGNIAGPALVTLLSFYLTEVITVAFTGHLGDPSIIAGAGLGSMYRILFLTFIGSQPLYVLLSHAE